MIYGSVVSSASVGNQRIKSVLILTISTLLVATCGRGNPQSENHTLAPTATVSPQAIPDTALPSTHLPEGADVQISPPPTPTLPTTVLPAAPDPTVDPGGFSTAVPSSPPPTPAVIQHTVQPGETLLGLATSHNVSMAAIQLANGMRDSIDLIAGQTLSIPASPQWPNERAFWAVHIVRAGETLIELSSTFDLTVDEILRVNAIADPALIHIDQQLILPLTQLVTAHTPQPTATPVAVAAAPAALKVQATSPPTEATTPVETVPATVPPPGPPAGEADWSGYILARINQVRAEHGLNTLAIAPELTRAAQAHAEDCHQRGSCSHTGSDGASVKDRLQRAGYQGSG